MWTLVALLACGIGVWFIARSDERTARKIGGGPLDWRHAAKSCGLEITESSWAVYPRLTARAGPVEVRIDTFGPQGQDTRIVVEAPVAPDFAEVKIQVQILSLRPAPEVRIGDPGFDDAFLIEGPTLQLFALLDADTRRRMRAVNAAGRLEISRDRIVAVLSGGGWVSDVLPSLLKIGKRLGTPAEIPRSLVENVKRDSESGVRLQNLLLLLRELPGDPATVEALRAACSDWSPSIRLRAARELGAEGRDALLELAQSLDDDDVSAEAVSILDQGELPLERVEALLDHARVSGRLRTALACVEVLGRKGTVAVGLLAQVLAGQNVKLAAAAARVLTASGRPDAEPPLIQALQHEEPDIQMVAARALGRIGSASAVLPLKEAAERSGRDLGLRQAARQAIAEIQSRAEGASPGQLSLAGAETGQLSLAQDPAGQLSLRGDEKPEREL